MTTTAKQLRGPSLPSRSDHALVLIDRQSEMAFAIKFIDVITLSINSALISKAASPFKLPVVLTTVAEKTISGPIFNEIKNALPNSPVFELSTMACWEDAYVTAKVNRTAKPRVVLAGRSIRVCIVDPAIWLSTGGLKSWESPMSAAT